MKHALSLIVTCFQQFKIMMHVCGYEHIIAWIIIGAEIIKISYPQVHVWLQQHCGRNISQSLGQGLQNPNRDKFYCKNDDWLWFDYSLQKNSKGGYSCGWLNIWLQSFDISAHNFHRVLSHCGWRKIMVYRRAATMFFLRLYLSTCNSERQRKTE